MKITIQEVARRTGVSTKTVSRVIFHQSEISAETRTCAHTVINEIRYRPNILSPSLASRHSNMPGIVAWGLDYYTPSRTVIGTEQRSS